MPYADSNGISIYYEEHGTGEIPLLLLHGGFGSTEGFAGLIPQLAANRRVVAVDLQGHGRTPDADRPLRIETLADDVAGLIEHLGGTADVLGYSFGGAVATRLAIQHPDRLRNAIVISIAIRRDGNFPEVVAVFDQMTPAFADILRQGPVWETYERVAPNPGDFDALVRKSVELLQGEYDWSDEVATITTRTLLIYADADSVRPDHITEFAGLLGLGLRDPGWEGDGQPANQLAILPGRSHYDLLEAPLLVPVIETFLGDAA